MRILFLGSTGHDVLGSISKYCEKAFVQLGCKIKLFDLRESQFFKTPGLSIFKEKIKKFLPSSPRRIGFINLVERSKMNHSLFNAVLEFKPDIVFTLNGEKVSPTTLQELKKNAKIKLVNWFIDPLMSSYHRKLVETTSRFYDFFFMIDSMEILKSINISAKHIFSLPMACDPDIHKTIELTSDETNVYGSDISFVGTINPTRERILENLMEFDLKIWAPPSLTDGRSLAKGSKLGKYYQGKSVWGNELIKVYNASKINLEIHSQYGRLHFSSTPRIFEINGCGGFLLADFNSNISALFEIGKELICYKDEKDLYDKVLYYLNHPNRRRIISERGRKRTYREHTYYHRLSKIIERIG